MIRTDIHRPSAINPEEYTFVGFEYMKTEGMGSVHVISENRQRIKAHMANTGGTYSQHQHGGNCHICGAHAIYTVLFYHSVSNSYIRTGEDCAGKLEGGDMDAFRTAIQAANQLQAGKRKAEHILTQNNLQAAWTLYKAEPMPNMSRDQGTVRDIVRNVVKYGNMSEPQVRFVRVLLSKIENASVVEIQRAVEVENAKPVPVNAGRFRIVGEVLAVKPSEGFYGGSRMLVKHVDGWKVWGSVPATESGIKRGDKVSFTADITPSPSDSKFGFFKRPLKAVVLNEAV